MKAFRGAGSLGPASLRAWANQGPTPRVPPLHPIISEQRSEKTSLSALSCQTFSSLSLSVQSPLSVIPPIYHPSQTMVRHFSRGVLDAKELGSINLLEIKRFLRQKVIDYEESHSCLAITLPKHILTSKNTLFSLIQ